MHEKGQYQHLELMLKTKEKTLANVKSDLMQERFASKQFIFVIQFLFPMNQVGYRSSWDYYEFNDFYRLKIFQTQPKFLPIHYW